MLPVSHRCAGDSALVFGGLLKLAFALGLVERLGLGRAVAQCRGCALFGRLLAFFITEVHKESAQAEADSTADNEKNKGWSFHLVKGFAV